MKRRPAGYSDDKKGKGAAGKREGGARKSTPFKSSRPSSSGRGETGGKRFTRKGEGESEGGARKSTGFKPARPYSTGARTGEGSKRFTRKDEAGEREGGARKTTGFKSARPYSAGARTGDSSKRFTRKDEGGERESGARKTTGSRPAKPYGSGARTGDSSKRFTRKDDGGEREGGARRTTGSRSAKPYGSGARTGDSSKRFTRKDDGGEGEGRARKTPFKRADQGRDEGAGKRFSGRGEPKGKPYGAGRTYTKRDDSEGAERKPRFTRDEKPAGRTGGRTSDRSASPARTYVKKDGEDKGGYESKRKYSSGHSRNTDDRKTARTSSRVVRPGSKNTRDKKGAREEESAEADTNMRLNRYISNAGVSSRREADNLISAGLVSVNGKIITEMGYQVQPGDDVRYNGTRLNADKKVYILMNKPKDMITTLDDPDGRKIVTDILKGEDLPRVYPVGRLDRNTTGVLLLTNDGEMAQRLMHPKYEVQKIYKATLMKNFRGEDLWTLSNGVELEDGFIKPDSIATDPVAKNEVAIEIHSGRNRIIHRIFEHVGYPLEKLDRLWYAGLNKKSLKRGEWRTLEDREIKTLKKLVKLK